jgi:hypothetical protein
LLAIRSSNASLSFRGFFGCGAGLTCFALITCFGWALDPLALTLAFMILATALAAFLGAALRGAFLGLRMVLDFTDRVLALLAFFTERAAFLPFLTAKESPGEHRLSAFSNSIYAIFIYKGSLFSVN